MKWHTQQHILCSVTFKFLQGIRVRALLVFSGNVSHAYHPLHDDAAYCIPYFGIAIPAQQHTVSVEQHAYYWHMSGFHRE
jgi:hypothetical protein